MTEAERILLRDLYRQEAAHYAGLAATAKKLADFYDGAKPVIVNASPLTAMRLTRVTGCDAIF